MSDPRKTCKKCLTEKPVESFRTRTSDGYVYRIGTCVECERKEQKLWCGRNPEKVSAQKRRYRARYLERIRAYDRARDRNLERLAQINATTHARENTPEGRLAKTAQIRRWRQAHPEKYVAQTAVSNALRDGKLKKGPCARCSDTRRVVGHHHDYSRPLEVTWLCPACHGAEHRELRWGQQELRV